MPRCVSRDTSSRGVKTLAKQAAGDKEEQNQFNSSLVIAIDIMWILFSVDFPVFTTHNCFAWYVVHIYVNSFHQFPLWLAFSKLCIWTAYVFSILHYFMHCIYQVCVLIIVLFVRQDLRVTGAITDACGRPPLSATSITQILSPDNNAQIYNNTQIMSEDNQTPRLPLCVRYFTIPITFVCL